MGKTQRSLKALYSEENRLQLTKDMERYMDKVQKEWYEQNGEKIAQLQLTVKEKDERINRLKNQLLKAGLIPES